MRYLITDTAGFIGSAVSQRLCQQAHTVIGIDNLNDYYEISLKDNRLTILAAESNFMFRKIDLTDRERIAELFAREHFDRVIHLTAQPGGRYSLENLFSYADSNLAGQLVILKAVLITISNIRFMPLPAPSMV